MTSEETLKNVLAPSWEPLGSLLGTSWGPFWGVLGAIWGVLERLGTYKITLNSFSPPLGPPRGPLGRLAETQNELLGATWALKCGPKTPKRPPNTSQEGPQGVQERPKRVPRPFLCVSTALQMRFIEKMQKPSKML